MRRLTPILLTALLAGGLSHAQVQIDKRRPAGPKTEVYVENTFGSVEIVGWDRNEVAVTGLLAAGAEGLDLDGDKEGVNIDVEIPDAWLYGAAVDTEYRTTLTIHVPAQSSIEVETLNASVTIRGVTGALSVETVNGPVTIEGKPTEVDVNTMTGAVEVRAAAAAMEVETISGTVTLVGASRTSEVTTVSGTIDIKGGDFRSVELKSTSGDVRFEGGIRAGEGKLSVETFSGSVSLLLRPDVRARFELMTFGGKIDSALGAETNTEGRFSPYRKLRFSTGPDDFEIGVQTYQGDITLRLAGAANGEKGGR